MSDPIIDLEIRLAYQEDLLDALNSQIADQSTEIANLKQQLSTLIGKLAHITPSSGDIEHNMSGVELPPHY